MKIIPPKTLTDAMLISCSIAEPDPATSETAWSATEICAKGDQRYIGSPTATVTFTPGTPVVVNWTANGLPIDTPVVFSNSGGALPTGVNASQTYYLSERLTENTFTVSDELGGRAISATGSGTGTHTATAKVHRIYQAAVGQKATVTVDTAADTVSYPGHGFAADTELVFTNSGGALPAPLVAGTTYYAKSPATDTFQVAATKGGAAINLTTTGTGTHTCGLAANYNKPPAINTKEAAADPVLWVDAGPTNRWAAFDESLSTAAKANDYETWKVKPGRFNSFAVKEANAASLYADFQIKQTVVTISNASPAVVSWAAHGFAADTKIILETDGTLPGPFATETIYYVRNPLTNSFELSLTPGGASINATSAGSGTHTAGQCIYQASINLTSGVKVGSWYAYFNTKIVQKESVAAIEVVDASLFDLPSYGEGILTITLRRTGGTVSLGAIVFGKSFTIGDTLPGPEISILDKSKNEEDDFGNIYITRRSYRDLQTAYVRTPKASVDSVVAFLKAYRGRPVFIVTDESNTYSCLQVYGRVADWSAPIASKENPMYSTFAVKLDGLPVD